MASPSAEEWSHVTLYGHPVSVAYRAVALLVAELKLPIKHVMIDITKGEHLTPEYTKVNPNKTIPALQDGDLLLTESVAIMKYLCDRAGEVGHGPYPTGLRARARVDSVLDWFNITFYKPWGMQFIYPQLFPNLRRETKESQDGTVSWGKKKSLELLRTLEEYYLGPTKNWLCGTVSESYSGPTLADIYGSSILGQGDLIGVDWTGYPNISRWIGNVRRIGNYSTVFAAQTAFVESLKDKPFVTIRPADVLAPSSTPVAPLFDGTAGIVDLKESGEGEEVKGELFCFGASAAARGPMLLVSEAGLPVQLTIVDLMKGEHMRPEYLAVNPNHAVPAYREGDFTLTECSAILKHIARRFHSDRYPTDLKLRAQVDAMMDWFGTGFMLEFLYHYLYPQLFPIHKRESPALTEAVAEWGRAKCLPFLKTLNDIYLADDRKFLVGGSVTIADMMGAAFATVGDYARVDFAASGFPAITRWLANVKAATQPGWGTAHGMHDAITPLFAAAPIIPLRPPGGETTAAAAAAAAPTTATAAPVPTSTPSSSSSTSSSSGVDWKSMKMWGHPLSVLSRAVSLLLAELGIEIPLIPIDITRGEHMHPDFALVNPNRTIPCLRDGDLLLTESSAIMKYICDRAGASASYPTGLRSRARVDGVIDWFNVTFAKPWAGQLIYPQLFPPLRREGEHQDATLAWGKKKSLDYLRTLEEYYVGPTKTWLCSSRLPTIADYFGVALIGQGDLIGVEWTGYPNISRWRDNVARLPAYAGIWGAMNGFVASLRGKPFVTIRASDVLGPSAHPFAPMGTIEDLKESGEGEEVKGELFCFGASAAARGPMLLVSDAQMPVQLTIIDLMKGEHMRAEFLAVNPNHAVPTYREGDFTLTEGSAILKHLARRFRSDRYPTELKLRAQVDAMMDWFSTGFFFEFLYNYLYPQLFPIHKRETPALTAGVAEWGRSRSLGLLKTLNDVYLSGDRNFLIGSSVTIADMLGACLVTVADYARVDFTAAGFPAITRWLANTKAATQPGWGRAHGMHDAIIPLFVSAPIIPLIPVTPTATPTVTPAPTPAPETKDEAKFSRDWSGVTLYYHPASTRSRTVLLMVNELRLPITLKVLDLQKGEHLGAVYSKLNPSHQIPTLVDGDFVLTESSAILKYLADRGGLSSVYPTGSRARARVDQLIDWFNSFDKNYGALLIAPQLLPHHRRESKSDQDSALAWGRAKSLEALRILDVYYLGAERQWICGGSIPSIADYFAGVVLGAGDLIGADFSAYPHITRWMNNIRKLPTWAATDAVRAAWATSMRDRSFVTIRASDALPAFSHAFRPLPGLESIREDEIKGGELFYHGAATSARSSLLLVHDHATMMSGLTQTVVDVTRGEQTRPAYLMVNPNHAVPAYRELGDGASAENPSFLLTESSAILKYLCRKFQSDRYPTELKARAQVDAMLDWFLTNFQMEWCYHFLYPQLFPMFKREPAPVNAAVIEWGRTHAIPLLRVLNDVHLAGDRKFVCGATLTLADYVGATLLTVGELARVDWGPVGVPNVVRWLANVKAATAWARANVVHDTIVPMFGQLPMMPLIPK